MAGYETAFTIKEISEADIAKLQTFAQGIPEIIDRYAKNLNVKLKPAQQKHILNIFLGIHASCAQNFEFKIADSTLILSIVRITKEELERNEGLYDVFEEGDNDKNDTVITPIGSFFGKAEPKQSKQQNKIRNGTKSANDGVNTESAKLNEPELIDYAAKLLRASFSVQMRAVLKEYTTEKVQEKKFLENCGLNMENSDFPVLFNDENLKIFVKECSEFGQEGISNEVNQLASNVPCYCSKDSAILISAYFRPNNRFQTILQNASADLDASANKIYTCWLLGNFKRHLKSHVNIHCNDATAIEPAVNNAIDQAANDDFELTLDEAANNDADKTALGGDVDIISIPPPPTPHLNGTCDLIVFKISHTSRNDFLEIF